jgi:hypothetical protein
MDYLLNRYKPVAPFLQLVNNSRKSLNNVLPWISNLNISPVVKQNDLLTLFPLQSVPDNLFNNSFGRSTLVVVRSRSTSANVPEYHKISHLFQLLIHAGCVYAKRRSVIARMKTSSGHDQILRLPDVSLKVCGWHLG